MSMLTFVRMTLMREEDDSPEKYRASVEKLTIEELIQLTTTGKDFTLGEFVDLYPR